jgi:cell division protein FtsL
VKDVNKVVVAKKQMVIEQPEKTNQAPIPKKTEETVSVSAAQVLHQRVVPVLLVLVVFVLAMMLIVRYTKISNMQIEINNLSQEIGKQEILTNQLELELSRCYNVAYAERDLIVQQNMNDAGQTVVYVDTSDSQMLTDSELTN